MFRIFGSSCTLFSAFHRTAPRSRSSCGASAVKTFLKGDCPQVLDSRTMRLGATRPRTCRLSGIARRGIHCFKRCQVTPCTVFRTQPGRSYCPGDSHAHERARTCSASPEATNVARPGMTNRQAIIVKRAYVSRFRSVYVTYFVSVFAREACFPRKHLRQRFCRVQMPWARAVVHFRHLPLSVFATNHATTTIGYFPYSG